MKVRIAHTDTVVTMTPRGRAGSFHTNGFIRLKGKTITGYAYDGGVSNPVFYPEGINAWVPYVADTKAA
jgi:hypothetical protein